MSEDLRDTITRLFVSFSGQGASLVIPRPYIDLCGGDHLAALLLSQILYWAERTKDPNGWFAKSYNDWRTELAMTDYQIKRALHGDKRSKTLFKGLCSIGVQVKLRPSPFYGGAPVLHYRVDRVVLQTTVMGYIENHVQATTHNEQCPEPNIVTPPVLNIVDPVPPNNVQNQYTETTTETTTEIKPPVVAVSSNGNGIPVDEPSPEPPRIYGIYVENMRQQITPLVRDALVDAVKTYGEQWVEDALKAAVSNNVLKWTYVSAILERWGKEGRAPKPKSSARAAPVTIPVESTSNGGADRYSPDGRKFL